MKKFLFLLFSISFTQAELRNIKDLQFVNSLEEEIALTKNDLAPWQAYRDKSNKMREQEMAILKAEVGEGKYLKAPSGGDFKFRNDQKGEAYKTEAARKIADVMISFQTPAGGWTKKLSANAGTRQKGMSWSTQSNSLEKFHYCGTFDNRATTEQVRLMAGMYQATQEKKYVESFQKGMNYIFDAQYPNGGFPQCYPLEHAYHDMITLNDDAMIHVLEILHDVAYGKKEFTFADEEMKKRASLAYDRGIDCLLKAQVIINQKKTVWCAQHAPISLKPVGARLKEPPSLSGGESADLVKFLMNQEKQTPEIVQAIEAAVTWFKANQVTNPKNNVLCWARFYDLESGKPIFAGATDGLLYDSFDEMKKTNKLTGYDFYTTHGKDITTKGEVKWRQRLAEVK